MIVELLGVKQAKELAVPSNLTMSAHDISSITLTWTNGDASALMDVYENGTIVQVMTAGTATVTRTGLSANTGYVYQIRHRKADGAFSIRTPVLSAYTTLAAPYGLGASVTGSTVTLTWTDIVTGATVHVYRNGTNIATVAFGVQTYVDSGLSGATYAYTVRSFLTPNESVDSNEVDPVVPSAPSTPTSPSATPLSGSGTEIDLAWTVVTAGSATEVYRGTSANPTTLIVTTAADAATYSDTGLTPNTTYHYRLKAIKSTLESGYTSDFSATTHNPPSGPPTGLGNTIPYTDRVSLTWTNGDAGAQIEVIRGGTIIATLAATTTSYNDDTVVAGTTYSYTLKHLKDSIESSATSASSAVVPANAFADQVLTAVIGFGNASLAFSIAQGPRSVTTSLAAWDDGDGDTGSDVSPFTSGQSVTLGFTIRGKNPGVTHEVDLVFGMEMRDHTGTVVYTDTSFAAAVYKDNP